MLLFFVHHIYRCLCLYMDGNVCWENTIQFGFIIFVAVFIVYPKHNCAFAILGQSRTEETVTKDKRIHIKVSS